MKTVRCLYSPKRITKRLQIPSQAGITQDFQGMFTDGIPTRCNVDWVSSCTVDSYQPLLSFVR